jgi:uncharacterized protein (TIGR03067 family)
MQSLELIASMLGVLIAAGSGSDTAKQDLAKFQGNWTLISAERDGKKTPEVEAKKLKLTIHGNKFVLRKDSVVISEGTMTLDPTKRPKEVDERITTGPNKGKVFSAIYEIDDEQHRICFAAAGKERPTAFSSTSGSGRLLQLWRREKK